MFHIYKDEVEKEEENNTQTLIESQENVFQKISAVFSQDSQSTFYEEFENALIQNAGTASFFTVQDVEKTNFSQTNIESKSPAKQKIHSQTPDSGLPKSIDSSRNSGADPVKATKCDLVAETEDSQVSLSLLHESYKRVSRNEFSELIQMCKDSELEPVNIYTDDEIGEEKDEEPIWRCTIKVENSTQTDDVSTQNYVVTNKEKEIRKHSLFIGSIIKLKRILSSKEKVTGTAIWKAILRSAKDELPNRMEVDLQNEMPKETVNYVLRSTNAEKIFLDTVQVLLQHLSDLLKHDFFNIASSWEGSLYDTAVGILNESAITDSGVWKIVNPFVCSVIDSISNEKQLKNLVLESKTNFVIQFCRSPRMSCTAINFIIRKLKGLEAITRVYEFSLKEKISWAQQIKNYYYLVRLLEYCLEIIKQEAVEGKIKKAFTAETEQKNYDVLKMWKKCWNREEILKEVENHECEMAVSDWCRALDEILRHCISHIPLLALAIGRCSSLGNEILKICHKGGLDSKKRRSQGAGNEVDVFLNTETDIMFKNNFDRESMHSDSDMDSE